MNINSPVLPRAAANEAGASNPPNTSPAGLNNMFLQLLVAQLQNQNPLDPMDPTQFVGQLAQFSELSEITQIDQLLQQNLPSASPQARTSVDQAQHSTHTITLPRIDSVVSHNGADVPVFNIEGLFSKGSPAPIQ